MKLAVQGRPIFGPYCTLRIRETKNVPTKVAFITSTKVMKLAVDRNRAKRRMRAIVRELWAELPANFSLLFILKPECKDVDYKKLTEEVRRLVGKIPEAMTKPPRISSRGTKYISKKKPTEKPAEQMAPVQTV
jgi:ribonuclease P protein component